MGGGDRQSAGKVLLLFTNSFPNNQNLAQYLFDEHQYHSCSFEEIYIFPLHWSEEKESHPVDKKAEVVDLVNQLGGTEKAGFRDLLQGIGIFFLEVFHGKRPLFYLKRSPYFLKKAVQTRLFAKKLTAFIKERELDRKLTVGYSYWFNDWAIVLAWAKKTEIVDRAVSRGHLAEVYFGKEGSSEENDLLSCFHHFKLHGLDKLYLINDHAKDFLKRKFPPFDKKMKTQYLGSQDQGENPFIPLDQETPSVFRVVSCGKMAPYKKRTHLFPEIFKHLSINVKWTHVRNVPTDWKEKIQKDVDELPNVEVKFAGNLSREELFELYRNQPFHLFLNISREEGLSVAMIEACSFGIPLMGTEVNGTPEVVTDRSGILIPLEFDPKEVAKKIEEFAFSETNSETFRKQVKEFWKERFDAEKNYRNFLQEISAF